GMLYFFYDTDRQPWGYDPDERGGWRVIYYDDKGPLKRVSRRELFSLPEGFFIPPQSINFSRELTLPDPESLYIETLALSEKERDAYYNLLETLGRFNMRPKDALHHLLGYTDAIQGEMQWECQLASNGYWLSACHTAKLKQKSKYREEVTDWRLLLQVDSDFFPWGGDCGRIYYWIRQHDLQTRSFGNVWLVLQDY